MTETEQPQDPPEAGGPPKRRRQRARAGRPGRADRPGKPETLRPPDHLNARPSWDCLICGDPWPCTVARAKLLREFQRFPSVLCIYLTAQMYDALNDLVSTGHLAPADLFERFLAWTRKSGANADATSIYDFDRLAKDPPTAAAA